MKISENWLRERVAIDADEATLVERLNMIGHEVESIERVGEELAGIVVGEIVECAKHPEADRLQVCRVDAGGGEVLQIVCGAPNARPGLKAPLAKIGAQVETDDQGRQTARRRIFRHAVFREGTGARCGRHRSARIPDDAPVGKALADYLGLPDSVIDLGLTPDRRDCLSIRWSRQQRWRRFRHAAGAADDRTGGTGNIAPHRRDLVRTR